MNDPHAETVLRLGRNRALAHAALFKHRHPDPTPAFHYEIIELWHSQVPRALVMAFREAAKSTIAEEALVIGAGYKLFRNALIIGESQPRAIDRLAAVKHEIDTNEFFIELFGELKAEIWNEGKIVLSNGICIQAFGRGQSVRGVKHLDIRPDFVFGDDLEDKEHVRDEDAMQETARWFFADVIPALDKRARVRVNATPLHPLALPMRLVKAPDWVHKVYPIEYVDEHGERRATWPGRYDLDWIDTKKDEMYREGLAQEYAQEYMCQSEDPKRKIFTADMFRVEPRVRTWQPTYAFYDPARTTKSTSATTGWACWSWIANRLIVWDGGGELWKPDEIINHIFQTDDDYAPVKIGVEEDGLNEFLMQPLRHEQVKRGYLVPVEPFKAPRGKENFIEGLQPFFLAKEIIFAKECPVLRSQFLSFPAGKIDGPNALAYALRLRPGQVIYDDFGAGNVVEDLPFRTRVPVWLALNAQGGVTTGVLVQLVEGVLHVLADYIREGDPGAVVGDIVKAAALDAAKPRLVAGARHFGGYDPVGLRGAVAKIPAELRTGAAEIVGRGELRALLQKQVKGLPALLVNARARWTLNAFSAGYAREINKQGHVSDEARPGLYRVLMEGLEAFAGMLATGMDDRDSNVNVQYTEGGQRFISALPAGPRPDTKADWLDNR